jgi:1,4-dihydroxy-2-naphthoyl-CoA hydrolase
MDALKKLDENMPPFAKHIGMEFIGAGKDRVLARLEVKPELCTIPAIAHGGLVMAFADTLGAAATILNLPEGAWTSTIESKTNFIAPAPAGTVITGETTPVHRGRRTMIWQTRVTGADGKLVALVTQTQIVLDGQAK